MFYTATMLMERKMRTSKEGPIGCWKSKCRIWCYVYILYFNCRLIWMVLIVDLISEGKHALCNKMNSLYFSGISRTLFLYTILKSRYGLFHTVYTKYLALICSSFFFSPFAYLLFFLNKVWLPASASIKDAHSHICGHQDLNPGGWSHALTSPPHKRCFPCCIMGN